jgi:hypothetical protein
MAALTSVTVHARLPVGNYFLITGKVESVTNADDQYVAKADLGVTEILNVVGACVDDSTPTAVAARKNCAATASAEDSSMGDLLLDTADASGCPVYFTILAR